MYAFGVIFHIYIKLFSELVWFLVVQNFKYSRSLTCAVLDPIKCRISSIFYLLTHQGALLSTQSSWSAQTLIYFKHPQNLQYRLNMIEILALGYALLLGPKYQSYRGNIAGSTGAWNIPNLELISLTVLIKRGHRAAADVISLEKLW